MLETFSDYIQGGFRLFILYALSKDLLSMIASRRFRHRFVGSPELISFEFDILCNKGGFKFSLVADLLAKNGEIKIFAKSSLISVPIGILLSYVSVLLALLFVPFLDMGSITYYLNFSPLLKVMTPLIRIFQEFMTTQTSQSSE